MTNHLDKMLWCVIIFCVVFIALWVLNPGQRVALLLPAQQEASIVVPGPTVGEEPPRSVTMSGCNVYRIEDGRAVRLGRLHSKSFDCVVLKEMSVGSDKYCLIQTVEEGSKADNWIVRSSDVICVNP